VKQVAGELGVRYVLEGSVRKAGGRVRITAQLIGALSATHLWADRFDGTLDDVFELQDKVAISVAGVIEPTLRQSEIERARRNRPDSLDAYDLYLRALPHAFTAMPEDADKALALLGKAIELEPDYAAAHATIAWCHEQRYLRAGPQEETLNAALRHARHAIAAGGDDAAALATGGFVIAAPGATMKPRSPLSTDRSRSPVRQPSRSASVRSCAPGRATTRPQSSRPTARSASAHSIR
jgi:adenylate cyclase